MKTSTERLEYKGLGVGVWNGESTKMYWSHWWPNEPVWKRLNAFCVNTLFLNFTHYLLTPWCRVLLEKLTGLQVVKKFPAFHGTRRFITALTSVRHLSLSWASPIQSIYPHPTSWRSILILSTHLRLGLPSGLLPSGLPTKTLYIPLSSPTFSNSPKTYAPLQVDIFVCRMALFALHSLCVWRQHVPDWVVTWRCVVWLFVHWFG